MIRFGILAGVSTDIQAEDRASIPDQIETCRRVIAQLGGVEVEHYIMDGYSRSGYDSLTDAMEEIPPLKQAIDHAQQGRYDVLILDNWDRLGDLGQLVNTRFKKFRKQIYSARQSGRLHDPEQYDPYSDESSDIDMHIQGIIQRYRINKMRRGWNAGMPKRIEKGLTPLRVPFGYSWVSSKEPPKLVPDQATLIRQLKDLCLQGRTLRELARFADRSGIAPPRGGAHWDPTTIRNILINTYYAGIVVLHRTKYIHDPRRKSKKRPVKQPSARWLKGKGQHESLWDEGTHRLLVKELERRYETSKYYAARYPLSGLLTCSECGQRLHRHGHGSGRTRRRVFSCKKGSSHIILPYEEAIDLVSTELVRQLREEPSAAPADADRRDERKKLEGERKQIQSGFRAGIYTESEAAEEIRKIEKKLDDLEHQENERELAAMVRVEFAQQLNDNIESIPLWIREDDPQVVNRILHMLCQQIVIHPDRRVEIIWRP